MHARHAPCVASKHAASAKMEAALSKLSNCEPGNPRDKLPRVRDCAALEPSLARSAHTLIVAAVHKRASWHMQLEAYGLDPSPRACAWARVHVLGCSTLVLGGQ